MDYKEIVEAIAESLVTSGSTFRADKVRAYECAIERETDVNARWVLQTILENAIIAGERKSPLCDDTGIPHVLLDVGEDVSVDAGLLRAIEHGVALGLERLPGRPMAVKGEGEDRLGQTLGMYDEPSAVQMAPIALRERRGRGLTAHVLMFGGGPAIRGRSFRVFHKHDAANVERQIVEWAMEACDLLGCTPCTLAIGIGRSHYEAANLMLQAQVDGCYDEQTPLEQRITNAVNEHGKGVMGLGGCTSVLATFAKIGPARASGVRIVCLRPCCCFEPRIASVKLD